jgi:hypothetical protein
MEGDAFSIPFFMSSGARRGAYNEVHKQRHGYEDCDSYEPGFRSGRTCRALTASDFMTLCRLAPQILRL